MLRSSLGFHTMTLFLSLKQSEVIPLIIDFAQYSQRTHLVNIYRKDEKGKEQEYKPTNDGTFLLPLDTRIKFVEYRGIKWRVLCNVKDPAFHSYIVEVTINPKFLAGIHDYITAATYDDMEAAITNFNLTSKSISPLLGTFEQYSIKRVDYCINFSLDELAPGCTAEQMISLIKRSDIPPHYKEWMEYDTTSHRMKTGPGSFYLMNDSVHINCYSKYMKLQEQTRKNIEKGYPPIPQATMDAAQDIIRFEAQCKYLKTYTLSNKAKEAGDNNPNKYESLLSHVACIDVVDKYYKKTIGRGDWYTLQEAVRRIQSEHFNSQKEKRLISALQFVNQCRSLAKAKEAYQGRDLAAFKRTLNDLSSLRINPVTIPREWGIKHIPNLLYAYFDKVEEEKMKESIEEFQLECLKEYLHA